MHDRAAQESSNQKFGTIIAFLLFAASAFVFLTYLAPQWYSFATSKVFVFANAWDEETYLSWQGAEGIKNTVGYYPLYLFWFMQKLGISGAIQNLICDTVLPPATAWIVYLSIRRLGLPVATASGLAVLICFGSVLFNAANPLISLQLGDTRSPTGWFMSPWEVYPSILRTPNPQVPFFLISVAVYAYMRFGKWWLLFLPLPLLYYYTAVAYVFVLLVSVTYALLRSRLCVGWLAAIGFATAFTFCVMGAGLVVLSYVMGLYQPDNLIRNTPFLFSETRRPQLPVGTVFLLAAFALGIGCGALRIRRRGVVAVLILGAASVGAANFHLITGFMLVQKNYYDYGISVLFSITLAVGIHALRGDVARGTALIAVLIAISILSGRTQRNWLWQATANGAAIAPAIDDIRRDPLRAIITDWQAAGKVAFSTPQLVSPISYLYWFGDAASQCSNLPTWVANAMDFQRSHLPSGSRELKESLDVAEKIMTAIQTRKSAQMDSAYCAQLDFLRKDFYIVAPK